MKLLIHASLATLVATTAFATSSAVAQDGDDSATVPLARRLFNEGVDAAHRSKWEVAHDRFKRAYELAPRLKTMFNLAGAQMQTNRLVDASESYRRFLRETNDGRYPDYRKDAQQLLTKLERRIPFARIRVIGLSPADRIDLDGEPFPAAGLGEPLPLNPGEHTVDVIRDKAIIGKRTFTLTEGDSMSVDLVVEKAPDKNDEPLPDNSNKTPPTAALVPPAKDDGDGGGSVLRSGWFWTAVVVVVAGGGAAGYLLTRDTVGDPTQGTLGRGVIDLTP